ncbi:MAG: endonuclease/exonuclease/phosphatase family protein [Aestuariivirga sp.]
MKFRGAAVNIVTYNIQWGKGRDGLIDLSRIASTVAGADIICLQEVERNWRVQEWPDQALRLAALMPDFDWIYGPAVDLAGDAQGMRRQIGNMTLSRWKIVSARNLPLPSWPVEGYMNDHQALLEAVVECPRPLRAYNVHLNYLSAEQRSAQLDQALGFIRSAPDWGGLVSAPGLAGPGPGDEWIVLPDDKLPPMPKRCLLMGDFNTEPGSAEFSKIMAEGFADALQLFGARPDKDITFPGHSNEHPQRLDHIFVSVELADKLTASWVDGKAAGSDHQPVWASLAET